MEAQLTEGRRRIRWTNVSIKTKVMARHCSPKGLMRTSATVNLNPIRAEHYPYLSSVLCPTSMI
jgi:hypothetical protein